MGKIQEAQEILQQLGLPTSQQNEVSALTLLALAQISETDSWAKAQAAHLRIHDILIEIKNRYDREYAENSRETIRKQVIHQFEQAGVVTRNPEDLSLPTNSPRTHYCIAPLALEVIQSYESDNWQQLLLSFRKKKGSLLEVYRNRRKQHKIPLVLSEEHTIELSPGKHNKLQVDIIEEFGPRFAPGAQLLYIGDAEHKLLYLAERHFEELNIPILNHDKLPDVILFDRKNEWLFLIEAVTSHGPVSPKRHYELEESLKNCPYGRVYVTAFPDLSTFKKFLGEIAWETEVWISEIPDHLVHFNGDRFLGPHNSKEA